MSVRSEYTVVGMTCEHCVSAVTGELIRLPGVRDVEVELETGRVVVDSDALLPLDEVRTAVNEAGYELAGANA